MLINMRLLHLTTTPLVILLFNDPTGKDNIIYLIWGGGTDISLEDVAKQATTMLGNLLGKEKMKVIVYDAKKNGKFDPNKLRITDSWAVIGSDRQTVASIAQKIDRLDKRTNRERYPDGTSDYEGFIDDWAKHAFGPLNPEISDRGRQDSFDGKGRGISVETEDLPADWKKRRHSKPFGLHSSQYTAQDITLEHSTPIRV